MSGEEIGKVALLYDRLLVFLRETYALETIHNIKHGPRSDGTTFEGSWVFVRSPGPVDLTAVEGDVWDYLGNAVVGKKIDVVLPTPTDY